MTTRTTRRVLAGALGATAGTLAFAPGAHAAELPNPADLVPAGLTGALDGMTPPAPTTPDPLAPLNDFAAKAAGVVPSNLLRTHSASTGDAVEAPVTDAPVRMAVDTQIEPMNETTVRQAVDNYNATGGIQAIPDALMDALNGHNDPNTIGQALGAWQLPNADTIDAISQDVGVLAERIQSGAIAGDIQQAVNDTLHSQAYEDWRTNTASILAVDDSLRDVDRAAAGIANLWDSASINPARTLLELGEAAGGPAAILDPVGAVVRMATAVLGPDMVGDLTGLLAAAPGDLLRSMAQAAPALLIPLATSAIGGLLGVPLGALVGSGIGAILGALAPHNLLAGLLTAIPGAILGGLATGIPGFIASLLVTLPLLGILPLLGAAGASALALVVLATVTYGLWLLTLIPVTGFALFLGVIGFLVVAVGGTIIGAGPAIVQPLGWSIAAISIIGGIYTFLFLTVMTIALYMLATFLIPMIAFLVLAPWFLVPAAALGGLAGLIPALVAAAIGIPLITALSAIPGALAGGLAGFLAGTALSSLISALIGAGLGGLIGAGIGGLIGAVLGGLVGLPFALGLFAVITAMTFADVFGDRAAGPLGALKDALDRGWQQSFLGRLIGELQRNFMEGTETGRAWGDLMARINGIMRSLVFLDGRRLRDMLLRGGLLGSLTGMIPGAITGGTLGALAGLFNPLNLLNALMGGIAAAIPGALGGALAGSLLSDLLGALVGTGAGLLSFLPWLGILAALWAVPAIPIMMTALAMTLIPPIAIATAAWVLISLAVSSPLWIPLTIVSTVATLVMIFSFGVMNWAGAAGLVPGLQALLPAALPAAGVGVGAGAISGPTAFINALVVIGALLIGLPLVWLPTFIITAPLFLFGALIPIGAVLLTLPLLLPLAAGASMLTGLTVGAITDGLSKLLAVPLGALIGGLAAFPVGAIPALIVSALTRAVTYGAAGTGIGALIGAALGFLPGVIAALLTHLRAAAGSEPDGTQWVDGRIVDKGGFGDILSGVPGLGGGSSAPRMALPSVGLPRVGDLTAPLTDKLSVRNSSELVGM